MDSYQRSHPDDVEKYLMLGLNRCDRGWPSFFVLTSMEELIQIRKSEGGKDVVSAKDLYDFLGMGKSQWSRWYKKNIEDNPYAVEMKDWMGFDIMSNGNITRDFQLTIDFAKKLSMLSRTEIGEKVRDYFVECEKRLAKSVISIPNFSDPAAAARAWADQYEKRSLAEAKIQEDAPKVLAAEVLLDSGENLTVAQFAKVIDVGSVTLFQWLRDQKYLINKGVQHNLPYEVYKKQGLFIVKENPVELKNSTKIHLQTFVTPKGQLRLTNHWVSSRA